MVSFQALTAALPLCLPQDGGNKLCKARLDKLRIPLHMWLGKPKNRKGQSENPAPRLQEQETPEKPGRYGVSLKKDPAVKLRASCVSFAREETCSEVIHKGCSLALHPWLTELEAGLSTEMSLRIIWGQGGPGCC